MAGKQIFELDVGVRNRTNVLAQQDSAGANDATQISTDELLQNLLLTDIPQSGATNNQALIWNGTQWAPGDVATATAQQIVYVSKTGSDTNVGTNPNAPFLTISAAITEANTLGYNLVYVLDGGTYTGDITCVDGIDVYAPNATFSFDNTQLTLAGQRTRVHKIVRSTGGNACVLNTGAGDTSFLSVDIIEDNGAGVTIRNTQTTVLILYADIVDILGGGIGIADFTSGAHTHLYIRDIYLSSDNAIGLQRNNAGKTVGYIEHIVIQNAANGTTAIDCNGGQADISVNSIVAATAYDVSAGSTLNLFVNSLSGTQTNAGTTNVLALDSTSKIANGLTVGALTIDSTEINPTGHTSGQILQSNGTDFVPASLANLNGNPVINPTFSVVQRQVNPATLTTYNDGTYCADRWVLLTQDANGQFGQITGGGQRYAGQFKKTASGTTRLGTVQWIENVNCYHLRDTEVTLQLRVRCSEASKTIRCGIIESTKSADSLTRDPISDWSTTPVSLITDYTFSGTPGSVVSDTNWQTLSYTATLGSTFNNLGVLVWTETGLSQNATLDIEAVCVSISGASIVFVPRSISEELALCYWYFFRQYFPSQRTNIQFCMGNTGDNNRVLALWPFPLPMRSVPNFGHSGNNNFEILYTTFATSTNVSLDTASRTQAGINISHNGNLSEGVVALYRTALVNNAYLEAEIEL